MDSLIDLHSYVHDIDTAWLDNRGIEILGDDLYSKKLAPITADLEDNVYKEAYKNHSLANECENGVDDEKRVWWVQAESVVGFYNAWQKAPEKEYYLEAAKDIWEFIKNNLVDKKINSEWFWCTDQYGKPNKELPIVEPWKCPYHNGRMCFEIIKREQ